MTFSDEKPTMIEFKDVHKYYGDYHALRGINGTIKAGEFFSLLGPSGCGKTTLLRTIAGFEGISSGVVLVDDKDMAQVPANKRPTNMVFQSYAIFPHLTVAENIEIGLMTRGKGAKATLPNHPGLGKNQPPLATNRAIVCCVEKPMILTACVSMS